MKRFMIALALTSVLSLSALAGDMHTADSPAPAPSATPQGITSTSQRLPLQPLAICGPAIPHNLY